jgi:hypothetical protein
LIGVSNGGKAYLMKVNLSDWSMEKEDEIDLGTEHCMSVSFKGDGKIAIVVCSKYVVLEFGRNETNPDYLIFKRKYT